MRARVLVLIVVFLAVMALIGYLKPELKQLVQGCTTIEDQMELQEDQLSCEE